MVYGERSKEYGVWCMEKGNKIQEALILLITQHA